MAPASPLPLLPPRLTRREVGTYRVNSATLLRSTGFACNEAGVAEDVAVVVVAAVGLIVVSFVEQRLQRQRLFSDSDNYLYLY